MSRRATSLRPKGSSIEIVSPPSTTKQKRPPEEIINPPPTVKQKPSPKISTPSPTVKTPTIPPVKGQFSSPFSTTVIPCGQLNDTEEQDSLLLQQCPCDYVYEGGNVWTPVPITIPPQQFDYTFTRVKLPSATLLNPSQSIPTVCIPIQFADFALSSSNPTVRRGQYFQLQKAAALYRGYNRWIELVRSSFNRRTELIQMDIEQGWTGNQLNVPQESITTLEERVKPLEPILSQYLNTNFSLNRLATADIQQWTDYNNSIIEQFPSFSLSPEIPLIEASNPVIQQTLGVTESEPITLNRTVTRSDIVLYRQQHLPEAATLSNEEITRLILNQRRQIQDERNRDLAKSSLSFSIIYRLQLLQQETQNSIERIRALIQTEQQRLVDAQLEFGQFLTSVNGSIYSNNYIKGQLSDRAIKEFQFAARFPRTPSSQESDDFIPNQVYQLPSLFPVGQLYALTNTDVPSTLEFWARWLLSNYASEPERLGAAPLPPGVKGNANLQDFLANGSTIKSPNRISIPNEQFLDVLSKAYQQGSINNDDLALAEFAHDFSPQTNPPISPVYLSLLSPYVRSIVEQWTEATSQLNTITRRITGIEENINAFLAQRVFLEQRAQYERELRGFSIGKSLTPKAPTISFGAPSIPTTKTPSFSIGSTTVVTREQSTILQDRFRNQLIKALLSPQLVVPAVSESARTPFLLLNEAEEKANELEREPPVYDVPTINQFLRDSYNELSNLNRQQRELLASGSRQQMIRKVNRAISSFLLNKVWPTKEEIDQFGVIALTEQ